MATQSNRLVAVIANRGRAGTPSHTGGGPPTVISVISAGCRAGRTTVIVNLAVALAERGRHVLVLDADFVHPSVGALLGFEYRSGIDDLVTGAHTIDEVLVPIRRGVHFVPGSACTHEHREFSVREQAALIWALDAIPGQVDVLLIDTAAGLSAEVATLARAAHHLVVVVRDEPATLQHAHALIARLSTEHAIDRFKVLASQTRTLSAGTELYHKVRQGSDGLLNGTVEYAGSVPHDNCVRRALHTQQPVVEADPQSHAARAFRALAAEVDTWERPKGPRGHLEFFVERLVNAETEEAATG